MMKISPFLRSQTGVFAFTFIAGVTIGGVALLPLGIAQDGFTTEAPRSETPENAPSTEPPAAPSVEPIPTNSEPPAEASPKPVSPTPKEKKEPQQYTIQSGDNPWLIAKKHGVSLEALLDVNDIDDPKNLKIGDVLILPDGSKSQKKTKTEKSPEAAPMVEQPSEGDDWQLYTVKSGDNPWTIAKRLKVDHQAILDLNKGTNFRDLKIGQQIKIPKS